MFRTCAFCNGKLDGDGGPTDLGVGRRLAFDEWKGRLWVICPRCSRWNLAPLDDRLERIEALARAAADGRVAAATDHVALIRWHGYNLVRVGKPRRLELATWRYGERLRARRQEQLKFVVPMTVAAVGLAVAVNVAAGGPSGRGRGRSAPTEPRRGPARAHAAEPRPGPAPRLGDGGRRACRGRGAGASVERSRGNRRDRRRHAQLRPGDRRGAAPAQRAARSKEGRVGLTGPRRVLRPRHAARRVPRAPRPSQCRMTNRTKLGVTGRPPPRPCAR